MKMAVILSLAVALLALIAAVTVDAQKEGKVKPPAAAGTTVTGAPGLAKFKEGKHGLGHGYPKPGHGYPKPGDPKPPKPCKHWHPGCVKDDPVFVGNDGQQFYFHGRKDADFCIVADSNLHVNAHFIGRRADHMSRDFTWVQSLGILFGDHQLYVGAKKVASFDESVDYLVMAFDSSPVVLATAQDAVWAAPYAGVRITRTEDRNAVHVEVENQFSLTVNVVPVTEELNIKHQYGITADNCFAHLEANFQFKALTPTVAGVLGQTYAPGFKHQERKPGQKSLVMGGEKDYSSSSLMAADCKVAAFKGQRTNEVLFDFPQTTCSGGSGLVCRR